MITIKAPGLSMLRTSNIREPRQEPDLSDYKATASKLRVYDYPHYQKLASRS